MDARALRLLFVVAGPLCVSPRVAWLGEHGVYNEEGWSFQGFIEDPGGALRPQSIEESAFCEGCHGGIAATADSALRRSPQAAGAAGPTAALALLTKIAASPQS